MYTITCFIPIDHLLYSYNCLYILYVTCLFIYFYLALVDPSSALLLTTCHPKAVGGVCYATITDCVVDS